MALFGFWIPNDDGVPVDDLRAFCAAQFEPGVVGPSYNATAKAFGVRNATDAGAEEWLLLW